MSLNSFNQPIGEALPDFCAGELPNVQVLEGQYCRLEKLSVEKHLADLTALYGSDSPAEMWTYLPCEAAGDKAAVKQWLSELERSADPYYFSIIDKQRNKTVGTFALMRIDPANRVAEMGWVIYSPELKRSRIATEAQFLVMNYVFDTLQYRRYEWKCDSLNQPSINAAKRLGFVFEGIFRNAVVYKGRNRDTAWFSMLPNEWLAMKPKFERWLDTSNFDENGKQLRTLQSF